MPFSAAYEAAKPEPSDGTSSTVAASTITAAIAVRKASRNTTSSLSNAVACQVNPIHAHQAGTNSAAKRSSPSVVGSSRSCAASAATTATKQRSKNSSSQVELRSP